MLLKRYLHDKFNSILAPAENAEHAARIALKLMGNVYYVDGYNGKDTYCGDLKHPVKTIGAAHDLCTADNNDYIVVLKYQSSTTYALEATKPITITKSRVHIIGVHKFRGPFITPSTNTACFKFNAGANYCELAGFDLRAGAAHGCIEFGTGYTWGLVVHDCMFGHEGTGQDGIKIASGCDIAELRVYGCIFGHQLTRDGVRIESGGNATRGWIGVPGYPPNIFRKVAGIGINIAGAGTDLCGIHDNLFAPTADGAATAISINADSNNNCIVNGNICNHDDQADANNGFTDGGTNPWLLNFGKTGAAPGLTSSVPA